MQTLNLNNGVSILIRFNEMQIIKKSQSQRCASLNTCQSDCKTKRFVFR